MWSKHEKNVSQGLLCNDAAQTNKTGDLLKLHYITAESVETLNKYDMCDNWRAYYSEDRWTDTTDKCHSHCPLQPGLFIKVACSEWR